MDEPEFKFPKHRRIKDPQLLKDVRSCPCMACRSVGETQEYPTEAHHVTTRGAGGDDAWNNVMPLCSKHHEEWHRSPVKVIQKYPCVKNWLKLAERWDVLERYSPKQKERPTT